MLCFSTVLLMHFSIPRSASLFVESEWRSLILKRNTPSITESSMNWRHSSNAWYSATLSSFFIVWRFNFLWKLRWRFLSFVKQLRWYLASIEIMSPPEILAIISTSCKSVAIVFMFESCSKVWTEESCSISCSCSQNMHFSALRHLRLQSLLSSSTFGNFLFLWLAINMFLCTLVLLNLFRQFLCQPALWRAKLSAVSSVLKRKITGRAYIVLK